MMERRASTLPWRLKGPERKQDGEGRIFLSFQIHTNVQCPSCEKALWRVLVCVICRESMKT